jgi:uncharacterized Zn finger protein
MPTLESSVPVSIALISLHANDIKALVCPACGKSMELHQPDSGFPERMLWTCEHCGTWFLMDLTPGKPEAVLVLLPDGDFFRNAMVP